MPYTQNIDGCLQETIGESGLSSGELSAWLEKAATAVAELKDHHEHRTLAVLSYPEQEEDLAAIHAAAARLSEGADRVVVFGIGGSALGGITLAQLANESRQEAGPELLFLDNLDPGVLAAVLEPEALLKTKFLSISKSGGTPETLQQTLIALAELEKMGAGLNERMVAIAAPGNNPLRRLGQEKGFDVLEHHPALGGRYSVLSNVGMVPAVLLGLDPLAIRQGAWSALEPIARGADIETIFPAVGAALAVGLHKERGVIANNLMPYGNRLSRLGDWYRQLWAESLGKEGEGTLPLSSAGPVDQHSQLQLYLAGPNNIFHTLVTTDQSGKGPGLPAAAVDDARLVYLADRTVGDLLDAEQRATTETLIRNHRPTRHIGLKDIGEEAIGALFMHFMLETIIAAGLLGVEPYEQPAVEEGKVLARRYLGEAGA